MLSSLTRTINTLSTPKAQPACGGAPNLNALTSGINPSVDAITPNNGTTGGIRLRGNATTGNAYLQFTDSAASSQWGVITVTSTGLLNYSGTIYTIPAAGTLTTSSQIGYMGVPSSPGAATYSLSATDNGKQIYFTTTGQTLAIPANITTALPIGFTCVVVNAAAVSTTITITTDNLYIAGLGTGGAGVSRTLAAYGLATLTKVASTIWYITGTGVA